MVAYALNGGVHPRLRRAQQWKLMGTCKGHSSFVTHIGWSTDETRLFSNSGDYELLFWEMPSGKRVLDSGSCRDVQWAGYGGVLGWGVLGVWHKGADGTDVNTADRTPSHECLATGDDRGLVSLLLCLEHSFPQPSQPRILCCCLTPQRVGQTGDACPGRCSWCLTLFGGGGGDAGESVPVSGAGRQGQGVWRALEPRHCCALLCRWQTTIQRWRGRCVHIALGG